MMKNLTQAHRLFFMNLTLLSSIGIWLTGFDQVHWFVYIVPAALLFAALSGYCVGLDIARMVLKLFGIVGKEPSSA
jgi:hypothetical protein